MYGSYVKEGIELGKRPELVGGGLIRSLRGWEAVKKKKINGHERVRSDQRIKEDTYSGSREKVKADTKALFCYWAVRELGYGQRELARRLGRTQPGVGYAFIRGEVIALKF